MAEKRRIVNEKEDGGGERERRKVKTQRKILKNKKSHKIQSGGERRGGC